MTDRQITRVFGEIINLCAALGAENINELQGCWEYQVDDQWFIALNGHSKPAKCSRGGEVEPFGCYVEWNGWPAGTMNPFGGILAAGEAANEASFIAALKAAAEAVKEPA